MDNQLILLVLLALLLLINLILSSVTLSKLNKKDGYKNPAFFDLNRLKTDTARSIPISGGDMLSAR